ncbi:MAG: NAD(P)-binding protein [Proteobacteria bacterium]|nr:NAD(P)-binding protein [Pseudomonadota bacterium]
MKSIVIFGAGIAGLSAAHELAQLGYNVSVYEVTDQPGGFFRSSRLSQNNMPTEYYRFFFYLFLSACGYPPPSKSVLPA